MAPTVQMKDVAWIHNGYQPQTSYVSENGQASALLTVIKSGAASTLTIVDQVKAGASAHQSRTLKRANTDPDLRSIGAGAGFDPGRGAGGGNRRVSHGHDGDGVSWQLAKHADCERVHSLGGLFAIAVSSALGETINVMSLGGLALAVGMLVDDATVEIENTHRNLAVGNKKPLARAILDSAEQVAMPALISTMSISSYLCR